MYSLKGLDFSGFRTLIMPNNTQVIKHLQLEIIFNGMDACYFGS